MLSVMQTLKKFLKGTGEISSRAAVKIIIGHDS